MFYGTQYYRPPFPRRERWESDFENMEKLGFNLVKLWAVWNYIELEPGQFDFSDLDILVELAGKHGLQVIINMIPEGAPYWTFDGNIQNLYTTADNHVVVYGGPANIPSAGWPGRCPDDPEFSRLMLVFIEQTARHFSMKKHIAAFDVWNEPHLEPMYDYRSTMLCYCQHSKKAFIQWLKGKYHSIDALGDAWYRKYADWSQVEPPVRFGTWADMLDWRKFWLDNMSEWLRLRVQACKSGAPGVKVQTHVAYSGILGNKITGGLGNELGDEFSLARQVDIFGLSSFPKWLMGDQHYYRHLLHNEMVSEAAENKPFYQVELQGGAGKPGLLGGEVPTAKDIRVWNYNTIAAGGKGSVYWQYAPEPSGIESPGFGLTGFLGENTPRSISAASCARELNLEMLDHARKVSSANAVYVSRKSDMLCFASERREEMYAGSLSGVFKAAYQRCIPIRFFHEDQLASLLTSGIRVLYLPMPLVLDNEEIEIFEEFIRSGGTLISEACPGLYDANGLLDQSGSALQKLFNLTHVEIQGIRDWGEVEIFKDKQKYFTGRFYRQLAQLGIGVKILAQFADGEPAVTEHFVGKGRAIWIGTYPSYHFEQSGENLTGNFLASFLDAPGYAEIQSIHVSNLVGENPITAPVLRLLETDKEFIVVCVNHHEQPINLTIQFKHAKYAVTIHLDSLDGKVTSIPK